MTLTAITWEKLYQPNAWMFIAVRPTDLAIICQGHREKVTINKTGIIKISEDCIIKTKQNIIMPHSE